MRSENLDIIFGCVLMSRYEEMLEKFCAVMDPLLDTVPPEAGVGRKSLQGRVLDGWSKTKVLGGLLKRSANMEQREMA